MAAGPEVAAKVTPAGRMSAGDDGLQESLQESRFGADEELETLMGRVAAEWSRAERRNTYEVDDGAVGPSAGAGARSEAKRTARRRGPSVSVIASCEWCEQQVSFSKDTELEDLHRRDKEALVDGTRIHDMRFKRELERNVACGVAAEAEVVHVETANAVEALIVDVLLLLDNLETLVWAHVTGTSTNLELVGGTVNDNDDGGGGEEEEEEGDDGGFAHVSPKRRGCRGQGKGKGMLGHCR